MKLEWVRQGFRVTADPTVETAELFRDILLAAHADLLEMLDHAEPVVQNKFIAAEAAEEGKMRPRTKGGVVGE